MTIGKLSGQCDFGQKGQSYCNQRGQSCVAKRVKVAWLFHTLRNRTTRHYRNGKLDGSYHVESTRDGKPYITIEGQYTTARNRDVGNSTTPPMTQPMNGMNDFLFSQVDFIKLPPKVRTFGKRCYICK